jgi:hypothetical protein
MRKKVKSFSVAQRKHQHKFIVIGAVVSIHAQLTILIKDKMIPSGALKLSLIAAHDFMHRAVDQVREIEIILEDKNES